MAMHQLRYVVVVSRVGHSSGAAEQCHVSQPSPGKQKFDFREEGLELDFDHRCKLIVIESLGFLKTP